MQSEELVGYARTLGLDVDAFTDDLLVLRHRDRISEDVMGGVHSGVNGTPSLLINGELFDVPAEARLLTRAIKAARRGWHVAAALL